MYTQGHCISDDEVKCIVEEYDEDKNGKFDMVRRLAHASTLSF